MRRLHNTHRSARWAMVSLILDMGLMAIAASIFVSCSFIAIRVYMGREPDLGAAPQEVFGERLILFSVLMAALVIITMVWIVVGTVILILLALPGVRDLNRYGPGPLQPVAT